ncbi:hypothetical protein FB451DRAFT_1243033, partial [Mycena latifolia]
MATDLHARRRIQRLWKTKIEPQIALLLDGGDLSRDESTPLFTAVCDWTTAGHRLGRDPFSRYAELRVHVSRFLAAYTARIAAVTLDNVQCSLGSLGVTGCARRRRHGGRVLRRAMGRFSRGARVAGRALRFFQEHCVRPAGIELHTFSEMAHEQWKTRVFRRVVRRLKIVPEADPAWKARRDAITLA